MGNLDITDEESSEGGRLDDTQDYKSTTSSYYGNESPTTGLYKNGSFSGTFSQPTSIIKSYPSEKTLLIPSTSNSRSILKK